MNVSTATTTSTLWLKAKIGCSIPNMSQIRVWIGDVATGGSLHGGSVGDQRSNALDGWDASYGTGTRRRAGEGGGGARR